MQGKESVVLYDGRCGLCQRTVRFALPRARPGAVRFVDSGSKEGRRLLEERGLAATARDTLVVLAGGRAFLRSAAVVQVARRLRWPWRLQAALWLVPRPLRDWAYGQVARRRRRTCGLHAG